MTTAVRRSISLVAGLLGLFIAVMGFAHTRPGRPLLAVMGRFRHGRSCPLGYDRGATPAQRQEAASRFAASHRGATAASSRPALGFVLDGSRRGEVIAALAVHGVSCRSSAAADLVCTGVSSAALPGAPSGSPARELWFTFGAHDQLLSVVALSRAADPRTASAAFEATTSALSRRAGPVTNASGDGSAAALAAGALRQASAEFRFSNYYALARATNMGSGYLLTEEYRALVD